MSINPIVNAPESFICVLDIECERSNALPFGGYCIAEKGSWEKQKVWKTTYGSATSRRHLAVDMGLIRRVKRLIA